MIHGNQTNMTLPQKTDLPPRYNIAHRGARSLAPENTMAAFEKAWEVGAHGIEIDVQVTKDEELIIFHDDTLARTTNVKQIFPDRQNDPFPTFSLKEVQSLDAGSWYIETDPFGEIAAGNVSPSELAAMYGISVPTFADVLLFVKRKYWFINIEIKILPPEKEGFPIVERVLQLIDQVQIPLNRIVISSFVHDYLKQVQVKNSAIELNALIGVPGSGVQDWGNFEFETYNANADYIDENQIKKALLAGCRVNLFHVDELHEMNSFIQAGVSRLITDYPQRLVALEINE